MMFAQGQLIYCIHAQLVIDKNLKIEYWMKEKNG